MSVLVINRTESRFEAVVFASELRSMVREFMRRNFGVKDLHRIAKADGKELKEYFFKMDTHKMNVDHILSRLQNSVRAAECLYPTNMSEWTKRRDYLDNAIVCCNQIYAEFMQIIADFHVVDINTFRPCSDAIKREIALIKRWRQRDNKFKSRFNKQGNV